MIKRDDLSNGNCVIAGRGEGGVIQWLVSEFQWLHYQEAFAARGATWSSHTCL